MTRRKKAPLSLNIAYSLDWRGDDEEIPTWSFISAPRELLVEVFKWICSGGYIAKGFTLASEHAPKWRNGHSYWRTTVTLNQYDNQFCAITDLSLLIESRIRAVGHNITFFGNYNEYINI